MILAKMKVKDQWRQFWKRALSSTIVWQWLDTILFILIAFGGVFPWSVIWTIIISNYIFKLLLEIVLLPLTTYITTYLKKVEKEDVFDNDTNFSPLQW
jgi:uncharacterized PurR-regulated membrane protein YhhQ (DUF165 family)